MRQPQDPGRDKGSCLLVPPIQNSGHIRKYQSAEIPNQHLLLVVVLQISFCLEDNKVTGATLLFSLKLWVSYIGLTAAVGE